MQRKSQEIKHMGLIWKGNVIFLWLQRYRLDYIDH